ncbi:amino acid ABC transporter permease [Microcoleus sp. FACHB-SPT15]|uniref:amino acid ABC transporter permease n=1 Tax=Microcoleus sp. FACHB-SPT15 TaxID=2692830 RepID=UPI001785D812|nr:amino acid ABC transporter permease [Microcoleus sp. FACHB-SPT15]MBD1807317.1 amino acid ABC transporter permease [Microcoleus sp. FACHB-SPT15]
MTLEMAPPASVRPTPWNWARKNLFSTWYNVILSVVFLLVVFQAIRSLLVWSLTQAKWAVVSNNLRLYFAGRFPVDSIWRLWVILAIITFLGGLTWGNLQRQSRPWSRPILIGFAIAVALVLISPIGLNARLILCGQIALVAVGYWLGRQLDIKFSRWLPLLWVLSIPVVFWLLKGGLGLKSISTGDWTGLVLTLLTAVLSITLSFPLGVLLALGRQSALPVVRLLSTLYIEIVRGVPLIGILFLGMVMLPFFLPPELSQVDRVLRAITALTLFSAAYIAEDVRGGLQSVPRGQGEAARSLGLSAPLVVLLIVLPQAIRAVIPALVGTFLGLFKDTSLLAIFGFLELFGVSRTILANPEYIGRYAPVYFFIGLIYWIFCYAMSTASRRLEASLNVGQR